MSFQAGIVYFDSREIADHEVAALRGFVQTDEGASPTGHRQTGVFLAHAAARWTGEAPRPAQPHAGRTGAITFDGRLDNRDDLLVRLHSALRADESNAALALAAYETRGPDGLADLIGDWSLAIWDETRKTILLASDFAGVRPLYYCVQGNRALWSTRLLPLVNCAQAYEMDDEYVAGFLAFGGCPNRTPYRGVYSVPPGQAVQLTASGTRVVPFWRLPIADTIRYSRESEYDDHLRSLFREAVRCRIPDDSRCLCELSGGLDSSTIVSMADDMIRTGEVKPERLATLTVEHEGSRDAPFYQAVERTYGLESIHLSAEDHPFLNETDTGGALPAFWGPLQKEVARIARRFGATTYLTGKFGDDIMGNWWHTGDRVAGALRDGGLGPALKQALAWSKMLRVPISWVLWKALLASLPPSLLPGSPCRMTNSPDKSGQAEDSIAPGFRTRSGISDPQALFSREWVHARPGRRQHLRSLMQSLQLRRLQAPEAFAHLDYVQPYVHRPLVTFMLSIPPEVVCGPGEPRRLMRRAFQHLWPAELRQRRSKDSFGGVFLDSLRPLAAELLRQDRPLQVVEHGYVDRKSLETRFEKLAFSMNCNEPQLRQIILLELWLRGRDGRLRSESVSMPA